MSGYCDICTRFDSVRFSKNSYLGFPPVSFLYLILYLDQRTLYMYVHYYFQSLLFSLSTLDVNHDQGASNGYTIMFTSNNLYLVGQRLPLYLIIYRLKSDWRIETNSPASEVFAQHIERLFISS